MVPNTPVPMSSTPLTTARLTASLPKGKLANHKTGLGPGQAHNGDGAQQAGKPPAQTHEKPAQYKPQYVADCAHALTPT